MFHIVEEIFNSPSIDTETRSANKETKVFSFTAAASTERVFASTKANMSFQFEATTAAATALTTAANVSTTTVANVSTTTAANVSTTTVANISTTTAANVSTTTA